MNDTISFCLLNHCPNTDTEKTIYIDDSLGISTRLLVLVTILPLLCKAEKMRSELIFIFTTGNYF